MGGLAALLKLLLPLARPHPPLQRPGVATGPFVTDAEAAAWARRVPSGAPGSIVGAAAAGLRVAPPAAAAAAGGGGGVGGGGVRASLGGSGQGIVAGAGASADFATAHPLAAAAGAGTAGALVATVVAAAARAPAAQPAAQPRAGRGPGLLDVDARDGRGRTALHVACCRPHAHGPGMEACCVELLLAAGGGEGGAAWGGVGWGWDGMGWDGVL